MTDDEMVEACPDCNRAGELHRRDGRGNAYVGDPDARYACYACGKTFDEPVVRPKRENYHTGGPGPDISDSLLDRVRQATALSEPEATD